MGRSLGPRRVLPDGCMDILFVATPVGVTTSFVGAMTTAIVTRPSLVEERFFGVRFRPGAALAFVDVLADDARDLRVSALDVGLRDHDVIAETLHLRLPAAETVAALDAWLLQRGPRVRPDDALTARAARALMRAAPSEVPAIPALARALGTTERTLERAFRARVGVPPKTLVRVGRLERLVAHVDALGGTRVPWATLAVELGFSDQAHLVREVKSLTGVTPTALVRERLSESFNTAAEGGATSA